MTPAQITTLRALVQAEPTLASAIQSGDDGVIAAWLNSLASPAFTVWSSQMTVEQIAAAIEVGITQLDGLAANKREVLLWWSERPHSPKTSQAAISDMCGSQNTLKNALIAAGKRSASRAEKALASVADGNGANATPATLVFEGLVSPDDASSLR